MKFRVLSMVLALAALPWAGTAIAQPTSKPPSITEVRDAALEKERKLNEQFKEFQKQVSRLQERLALSDKIADQDQAKVLEKVLEQARDSSISTKFTQLNKLLRKNDFGSNADLGEAAAITTELAKKFQDLLVLYDSRANSAQEEMKKIQDALKLIAKTLNDEKNLRSLTEQGVTDNKQLAKIQESTTKQAEKIKELVTKKDGKDNKDNKDNKDKKPNEGGETKDQRSEAKDGGKNDKNKSEAKEGGKKNQGEAKEAPKTKDGKDSKPGESKGAEAKPNKGNEPKGNEAKSPESKAGEAKKGDKNSENKQANAKDSKSAKGSPSEAKDAKGKDSKGGDAKPSEAKDAKKKDGMEPKAKELGEAKGVKTKQEPKTAAEPKDKKDSGEAKAKDSKGDNKAGAKDSKDAKKNPDAKQADAKDAGKDSKQGEAKAGEPKAGQKSPSAKGSPMPPKDSDGPQAKGDKNDKGDSPPMPGAEKDPPLGKKQIQDVIEAMKKAEKDLHANKKDDASENEKKAITELEKLKKELEKRLLQLREEEQERLLAKLKDRLEKMLDMQTRVLSGADGTEQVFREIQATAEKKPADSHRQKSGKLADEEKNIVVEMVRFQELLEGEGSAVAFPEVARQVNEDMKHVQRRLDVTDVGPLTQTIERDIIATLKEMIEAVKKKEDDLDKKKKKDQQPKDAKQQGPPPDPKLLEQIAELKMIRAMQIRLNDRTKSYAQLFPGQEQPAEANIRRESRDLAERQDRIFDITRKIAQGDNR